jgi:Na+-driven multidrug efflux pump
LTKTKYDGKAMLRACTNGSSELMTNVSMSIVSILYNFQLLKYAGEDGIAAFGVVMYVNMIFLSAFIGYSIGTAPVVGFHFGAGNTDELKSLLRKSLCIIATFSLSMLILAIALIEPLSSVFVSYDKVLYDMTCRGFFFYSFSYLFSGFAIYGSGFFTALNDGLTSAIISFLRALVFQTIAILVLPLFFELDGVWHANTAAEILSAMIFFVFLMAKRKTYNY